MFWTFIAGILERLECYVLRSRCGEQDTRQAWTRKGAFVVNKYEVGPGWVGYRIFTAER